MSIRMKLWLSYLGMVLIPVALFLLFGYLLNTMLSPPGSRDMQSVINFGITIQNKKIDQLRYQIFQQLKTDPRRFFDPGFLRELETKQNLSSLSMGFIVFRDEQEVYHSPAIPSSLIQRLQRQKMYTTEGVQIQGRTFSCQPFRFLTKAGEVGDFYLWTDVTSLYRFGKTMMIVVPLGIILMIILTNGLLTYLMSRNLIRPLKALQQATEKIKTGRLDFDIPIHSKDELGKLAETFEEMRRRLKESLELKQQYETNRKELIAGISHDLKTPVSSIKGYVEGILDGVAGSPEKLKHYLQTIQTKVNSLDQLIDELFLFSKLDLGRLPFHFEKVHLQEMAQDFYQELRLELHEEDIELRFDNQSSQPIWVMADREKLARVIHNLVDNSKKYMTHDTAPQIVFGVKDGPLEATVWIGDNGRGISPNDLPFVFVSFFRAHGPRNSDTDGSGLGLAIAKRIIEEHGGRIWAESSLETGTIIGFSLPKEEGDDSNKGDDSNHRFHSNHRLREVRS